MPSQSVTSPTPAEHTALPETLAGHWTTPEGALKAREYAAMERKDLIFGDQSDFALANAQFMQMRDSLLLGQYQTGAKERIRWLSAKLAIAESTLTTQSALIETLRGERDEARTLVSEANNSLYGSQSYFHSLNGGKFNPAHLANGIEALKEQANKFMWQVRDTCVRAEKAESELAALQKHYDHLKAAYHEIPLGSIHDV
jgi:chromosome segregation ATPase